MCPMKSKLLLFSILTISLLFIASCNGNGDVERDIEESIYQGDISEGGFGCIELCFGYAMERNQEIENCAEVDLGKECAAYFEANTISVKEFQGEFSIFESGGGGIAQEGIAIDCSDALLTLEDIKPLGTKIEYPDDVINFKDYDTESFFNYCEIDITAEEVPPGHAAEYSGNPWKDEGVGPPDLKFVSSAGETTLFRFPNEYSATGDLQLDINVVYQKKYDAKIVDPYSLPGRKIIPFDLGDNAHFFESESVSRGFSYPERRDAIIDYYYSVEAFVKSGNCLLDDLDASVIRHNRIPNDLITNYLRVGETLEFKVNSDQYSITLENIIPSSDYRNPNADLRLNPGDHLLQERYYKAEGNKAARTTFAIDGKPHDRYIDLNGNGKIDIYFQGIYGSRDSEYSEIYMTLLKDQLEPIPEISKEEKEKVQNFVKKIAATILENAGCLS